MLIICHSPHCSICLGSGATGRNGGHLTETRQFFSEFSRVEQQQGIDEAMRAKALERHNVQGLVTFIHEHGLEETVDFVAGGLVTLFVTDEEYCVTREQYDAAKGAGVDVTGIEWLTAEETKTVSDFTLNVVVALTKL